MAEATNLAAARDKLAAQAHHLARLKRKVQALLDDARAAQDTSGRARSPAHLAAPPESSSKPPSSSFHQAVVDGELSLRDAVSSRAISERLDAQAREIVGLQRTLRWFQERRMQKLKANKTGEGRQELHQAAGDRGQTHRKNTVECNSTPVHREGEKKPRGGSESEASAKMKQTSVSVAKAASSPSASTSLQFSRQQMENQHAPDTSKKKKVSSAVDSDERLPRVSESKSVQNPKESFVPHGKEENYYQKFLPKGQYRKYQLPICICEDCDRLAVPTCAGYCFKHASDRGIYGEVKCAVQGCKKRRFKDNFCWKHACERGLMESPRCAVEGCDKQVQSKRVCFEHGGGTRYKHPDCFKAVVARGFCSSHRDQDLCKLDGCKQKGMLSGERKGYCVKHGGGYRCKFEGCTNGAKVKGFCRRHYRMVNESSSAASTKPPRGSKQRPPV